MAKGNMLLGHARGKVGDLVFARQNGQQTVRSRAAVVRNPQTEAQMIQRLFMNTIAQAYSKMSAIVDHSFEGIPAGQKSMSYFMKRNLAALRSRVAEERALDYDFSAIYAFTKLGQNYFAPNAYEIAKGQLPAVTIDGIYTQYAETDVPATDALTYQDVIDALGLNRGDQLTFIAIHGRSTTSDFKFARVILDPHNEDGSKAELSVAFMDGNAVNCPSPKNEGTVILSVQDDLLSFSFSESTAMTCAAVIVSRKKADGTWLRSNAQLAVSESGITMTGMSLQDCLDALVSGGLDTENPLYLNNAGTTSSGSGSSPAPVPTTDIQVLSCTKGGVAMTAGENGALPSGMEAAAVTGTLSGNNTAQKIYAVSSDSARPAVGDALPDGAVAMTISGTSFSGSAGWGDGLPGTTYYYAIVVAEGTTIKQVFASYTS